MGNIREREFYVLLGKDTDTDSKWKIQRQDDCFYTITMGAEFIYRSVSFVLKQKIHIAGHRSIKEERRRREAA